MVSMRIPRGLVVVCMAVTVIVIAATFCGTVGAGEGRASPAGESIDATAPKRDFEPGPADRRFAAEVGVGRVELSLVLESWLPIRHGTAAKARAGQLTREAAHESLAGAWTQAMETAVREELFYQEAVRDMDSLIAGLARRRYEAQTGSRSAYVEPPHAILRKVREAYRKRIDEVVQERVESQIRRAGGTQELQRILAAQGLTWELWQRRIQRRTMTDWYLRNRFPLGSMAEARPAEIRDYYKTHPQEFTIPGEITFRHIFIDLRKHDNEDDARERAGSIYDTIMDGTLTFEEAARRHSDDAVSAVVGGLDPLPKGANSQEALDTRRQAWLADVRAALVDTPAGEGSACDAVMVSSMGCHLAAVVERKPARMVPFAEAHERIGDMIKAKEWEAQVQALYLELRKDVAIRVLVPEYPSEYAIGATRPARPAPSASPARPSSELPPPSD